MNRASVRENQRRKRSESQRGGDGRRPRGRREADGQRRARGRRGGTRQRGLRENEGAGSGAGSRRHWTQQGPAPWGWGEGRAWLRPTREPGAQPQARLSQRRSRWEGAGRRVAQGQSRPLEPFVSPPMDVLKPPHPRGHVWPVPGTEPVPTQPWEPSRTASWGLGGQAPGPSLQSMSEVMGTRHPAASLLPGRAAGPRCGHGEQAAAGRSEDQVPGDRTHHLPTCIWGSSLPWPRPRFPPLPSGPRRWDDPSSSESRSSIFCFCFHF